eukprot:3794331-Prymnesium_polylepis.1
MAQPAEPPMGQPVHKADATLYPRAAGLRTRPRPSEAGPMRVCGGHNLRERLSPVRPLPDPAAPWWVIQKPRVKKTMVRDTKQRASITCAQIH